MKLASMILMGTAALAAQDGETARDWASLVGQRFRAERDVVYKTAGGFQAKLDY